MEKKTNKLKDITVYVICNNKQIKEYEINASRKFNIDDETYVIKNDCCYIKKINNVFKEIAFYVEGNPNPFKIDKHMNNIGLTSNELDNYIASDIFNIIIECQQQDKSKYTFQLVMIVFIFGVINFFTWVIGF